jgi:hypothetical protein
VKKRMAVLIDFRDEPGGEALRFKLLWVYRNFMDFVRKRGSGHHHIPISLIIDELPYLLSMRTLDQSLLEQDLMDLTDRVSRKGMLWVTLIEQRLNQLSEHAQATVMSLGTQVFGSVSDPDTAYALARRFYAYNPKWIREQQPVWASHYGHSDIIDYRDIQFTMAEQWEQHRRDFELPRYHFLAAVAPAEGIMGTKLRRLSIEHIDQGQYVDEERVSRARRRLMQLRGRRTTDVLQEIAQRSQSSQPQSAAPPVRDEQPMHARIGNH